VVVAGASRRAWGWHPLVDSWAARIVNDAGVAAGEIVLDIGAGRGALTGYLIAAGGRVLAIEPHPGRAAFLRERFAGQSVTVVETTVTQLYLPHRPFRVVANPPFASSSELMRVLLTRESRLVAADVVLQRAFVRRMVADRRRSAGRWSLTVGRPIPRNAFHSPPQVDAAILTVRRERP
jgi:23S rRNA (adenine-N6)-dimethyltransferase